ncbi:hypothetical protein CJ178_30465 [Rhodococcus sp. ACPA4]|nr:hypothetical protein CJ178_30465 [Rhodococcus sp. ACPA4]
MFPFLVVIVRHAGSYAAQCLGLFGPQLLPSGQTPLQLGPALRIRFGSDRSAEFVLAAWSGVVKPAGVTICGFCRDYTPVQARLAGVFVEPGAGRIDAGGGVVETLADVRGAAWAGFGFTHRRLDR